MVNILSADVLSRAITESGLGIIVTDPEANIIEASSKACEITGYPRRELIGRTPRMFQSRQTPASVYERLWSHLKCDEPWRGRLLNRRSDGTLFLDKESIVPCRLDNGKRVFVATHVDADVELQLRLQIERAGHNPAGACDEIERTRATISGLGPQHLEQVVQSLTATLDARDHTTANHGRRTGTLMELIGGPLGIFEHCSREAIRLGAILHDFGKIAMPDSILLKQGRLTQAELAVMKTHPAIGFDILRLSIKHDESLRIVRHHHERLDGSGYPDGLRGAEIPDYVKVFSVCDAFDAMTSVRPYRPAMTVADALSVLTDEALSGLLDMSAVRELKGLFQAGTLEDLISSAALV